MNTTCEIRIYDKNFNWLGVTRMAESVIYERSLYGGGRFELHIQADQKDAALLLKKNNIILINGNMHKAGIIKSFTLEESRDKASFAVYGITPEGMAATRITVPPTQAQNSQAYGWDKIHGNTETILKHFVNKNLVDAYDSKRNIPNLFIAEDKKRGKLHPWKSRYNDLLDELKNIAEYGKIGYEIYADLPRLCSH